MTFEILNKWKYISTECIIVGPPTFHFGINFYISVCSTIFYSDEMSISRIITCCVWNKFDSFNHDIEMHYKQAENIGQTM